MPKFSFKFSLPKVFCFLIYLDKAIIKYWRLALLSIYQEITYNGHIEFEYRPFIGYRSSMKIILPKKINISAFLILSIDLWTL